MDCGWDLGKHPCPLESATMPSNKISCHGSSLFGSPSSPHPPTVTSDMLLWCLRHIFLMFYTPYNPRCAEKAHFTCWHNWWRLWPCMGQADNEVFIATDTVRTREQTHTHRQSDVCRCCRWGLSLVWCVFQDGHFQTVGVFAKKNKIKCDTYSICLCC